MSEQLKRWRVMTPMNITDTRVEMKQVGTAVTNRDGTINVYLDAFPVSGRIKLVAENGSES